MGIVTKIGKLIKSKEIEFLGKSVDILKEKKLYFQKQLQLEANWSVGQKDIESPHKIKQQTIIKYQKQSDCQILVETGTYLGLMMHALKDRFKTLYSIEISEFLNRRAKKLYGDSKNLNFLLGDSGEQLEKLISTIHEPILFWLDGHYSGGVTGIGSLETPIIKELQTIFNHPLSKKHVILIDDARLFNGTRDYPKIEELQVFVKTQKENLEFYVENDIIVVLNKNA